MKKSYQQIWDLAFPYQDKRADLGHAATVLHYSQILLKLEKAKEAVVVPAAILHDVGWSRVPDQERINVFKRELTPQETFKIRRQHELAGVKIAKKILTTAKYKPELIPEILEIISQHDSRVGFISKDEGAVRDADKLWRYSRTGFWVDVKRRPQLTAGQWAEKLEARIVKPNFFYSENARKIARKELAKRRTEIKNPNCNI